MQPNSPDKAEEYDWRGVPVGPRIGPFWLGALLGLLIVAAVHVLSAVAVGAPPSSADEKIGRTITREVRRAEGRIERLGLRVNPITEVTIHGGRLFEDCVRARRDGCALAGDYDHARPGLERLLYVQRFHGAANIRYRRAGGWCPLRLVVLHEALHQSSYFHVGPTLHGGPGYRFAYQDIPAGQHDRGLEDLGADHLATYYVAFVIAYRDYRRGLCDGALAPGAPVRQARKRFGSWGHARQFLETPMHRRDWARWGR